MRAKNRLSPYPILCSFSDDYKNAYSFSSDISSYYDYGNISLNVEFNLNSPYLSKLIEEKKAQYITHVECPITSYRKRIGSSERFQTIVIPIQDLTSLLEVNTFIIALEDIEYKSDEFNDEYQGYSLKVAKNEIIAIGDSSKITINNNSESLESFPSIIKIIKVDDLGKAMSLDTDSDYIKIKLSSNACENYKRVGNSIFSKTAFSLVVFPAIMNILMRMKDADEIVREYRWFQIIEKKLNSKGITLESINPSDNSLLDACQKIFDDPIEKAFRELVDYNGGIDED